MEDGTLACTTFTHVYDKAKLVAIIQLLHESLVVDPCSLEFIGLIGAHIMIVNYYENGIL